MNFKPGDIVYVKWFGMSPWTGYGRVERIHGDTVNVFCQSNQQTGGFPTGCLRHVTELELITIKLQGLL